MSDNRKCPECGASVRDGGQWLDLSPRIEHVPCPRPHLPDEPSEAAVEAAHDAMLMQQVETGSDEISLKQVLRAAFAAERAQENQHG